MTRPDGWYWYREGNAWEAVEVSEGWLVSFVSGRRADVEALRGEWGPRLEPPSNGTIIDEEHVTRALEVLRRRTG